MPSRELAELRARLVEAEEALRAIRTGEVDTVAVSGKQGRQVFTLKGAESSYRMLIESMNEGALTLTSNKMILYANACFARMVKCPLEQVAGSSFRRFLSVDDAATLRPHMKKAARSGSKMQMMLLVGDGSRLPVQISVREMDNDGSGNITIGMVVTDMTETRRNEELLRGLSNRLVQASESERGGLALELHDHITQLLCAVLVRCQVLVGGLLTRNGPALQEVVKLRDMVGQAAQEVERISRNLRPGVLGELGLVAVLKSDGDKFAKRTGISLKLTCVQLPARLPPETELLFYRITQEALRNVEQHARARHVTVHLTQPGAFVELAITDDGVGFDTEHHPTKRKSLRGLGLVSMRERATGAGGQLSVKSAPRKGTSICVRVPFTHVVNRSIKNPQRRPKTSL